MDDGKKSKFNYSEFYGGYDDFAVNSGKYSMMEAVSIYRSEMSLDADQAIYVGNAFVSHHAGVNEDGESVVGWWLEYEEKKTSCPVYAMHLPANNGVFESRYTLVLPPKESLK